MPTIDFNNPASIAASATPEIDPDLLTPQQRAEYERTGVPQPDPNRPGFFFGEVTFWVDTNKNNVRDDGEILDINAGARLGYAKNYTEDGMIFKETGPFVFNHYHLDYENSLIAKVIFDHQVDPRYYPPETAERLPRTLSSHGLGQRIEMIYDPDGNGKPNPFRLLSMDVLRPLDVELQFSSGGRYVYHNLPEGHLEFVGRGVVWIPRELIAPASLQNFPIPRELFPMLQNFPIPRELFPIERGQKNVAGDTLTRVVLEPPKANPSDYFTVDNIEFSAPSASYLIFNPPRLDQALTVATLNNIGGAAAPSDGSHAANLAVLGQFAASSFVSAGDAHGTTPIPDQPSHQQPLLTQPHA